jgi:hypothetical protein
MTVFLVGDGEHDIFGIFTTRALAQAFIDRQRAITGRPLYFLSIDEYTLDACKDLS